MSVLQAMTRRGLFLVAVAVSLVTASAAAQAPGLEFLSCLSSARDCEASQAQLKREWRVALKGDYQAQRNVAFCLRSGCDGAIARNGVFGCAWRMVIVASGSSKVDESDAANAQSDCGALSPIGRVAAEEQAKKLFLTIYRRPLP